METDINKMSDRISNIYLDIFILWIDILASVKLQGLFSANRFAIHRKLIIFKNKLKDVLNIYYTLQ
jgi:hypothetical protein